MSNDPGRIKKSLGRWVERLQTITLQVIISEIRRFLKLEELIVTNIKQGNRNQNIVSPLSKLFDFGEFGIAKVYSW